MDIALREIFHAEEGDRDVERDALIAFLTSHEWPFHGSPRLTPEAAQAIATAGPTTRTFWVETDGAAVGVMRLLDVDDIGDGSPLFDLRLSPASRNRGVGRRAVERLVALVFAEYPAAHRIEATTREDNRAMRRVLELCGFRLEGQLRQTWRTPDGSRTDTAIYGLLRDDLVV